MSELTNKALAAIAAVAGTKAFKSAKSTLEEGAHSVDTWIRVTGEVIKGADTVSDQKNPAVDHTLFLAALMEGKRKSSLEAAVAKSRDEQFLAKFKASDTHKKIAELLGLPETVQRSRAGSVSSKGLKIADHLEDTGEVFVFPHNEVASLEAEVEALRAEVARLTGKATG